MNGVAVQWQELCANHPVDGVWVGSPLSGVLSVSLCCPKRRNAFDAGMVARLQGIFTALAAMSDERLPRLVLLEGSGSVFCAGADLAWMQKQRDKDFAANFADAMRLADMFFSVAACPVPVIAWARGAAMGGGLGLLTCADVVVAEEGTRFGTPEVRLGLVGATISPYLVRKLGVASASALLLSGDIWSTQHALARNLVQSVISANMDAGEVLKSYLAGGAQAMRASKRLMLDLSPLPNLSVRETTARVIAEARVCSEGQAGMQAFFEKRLPPWNEVEA